MSFTIPSRYGTWAGRYAYVVAAREKLRQEHNARVGRLDRLTMEEWIRANFTPTNCAITAAMNELRRDAPAREPSGANWRNRLAASFVRARKLNPRIDDPAAGAIEHELVTLRRAVPRSWIGEVELPAARTVSELPDPTEDFTGYTEVDPNSRITVTAGKLAMNNLQRNEDAYVYDDKGAAHFGASLEHLWEFYWTSADTWGRGNGWSLSNVIEESRYWLLNNSQAVMCYLYNNNTYEYIYCIEYESDDYDRSLVNYATQYYVTSTRSGGGGVDWTHVIRTGSHVGTIHDTIAMTGPSGRTYRYAFGMVSYNSGAAYKIKYDVENLDLQEVAAFTSKKALVVGGGIGV